MKFGEQWVYGGDRYPYKEPESHPPENGLFIMCPVDWDENGHPTVRWEEEWTLDAEVKPFRKWANLNHVENGPDRVGDKMGDEDGDGLVNLVEFAIGGNPLSGDDSAHLPKLGSDQDGMYFEYPRRLEAGSGITYQAQYTNDLTSGDWTDWTSPDVSTDPMSAEFEKVSHPLPGEAPNERFYRLKVLEP
jgi:hypothetical protein